MAYASAAEGGYGSSLSVIPTDASHAESISVSDAELLFRGQFHRAGPDLVLTGHDGRHYLIPGYFAGEKHPALVAPNGARLSPDLVDLLAGSPTPGEYAQTQPTAPPDAIGKVEKVVGDVTVTRNGVAVALHVGDAVYKSDVIQTGANSSVGIGFPDGTALNLVPNTRMALNEYSYDPNGTSNGALFSLVEGTFAFVAGKVAHTGGMNIETPVATMGIRGTTGFVEQVATITATVGNVTYSFAVVDDPGSTGHGQYDLIDANGNIIATVSQTGTVTYVTPQGPGAQPLVQVQAMTAAQVAFEQAIIQQVFQTLNLLNNPNQNSQPTPGTPGSSTPPGELNNLQHLLQENGGNPFAVNIPVPGSTGPTNVSGTVTITTNTTAELTPTSTVTWISATGGSWEGASNWSDGLVPLGWENVDILLPIKVGVDGAEEVASLVLGAGAILNIISGGTLTVANGISNSGLIEINSSGSDPTLAINGTVYLLDGGKIEMLGATAENLITGVPGSGATLVNVNNTIIGSGTIGQGDGALTLVNGSAGLIEAKPLLATDSGILVVDTGNTVSNSGVLEAAAGGTLQIDDALNNLGTILADGGTVNIADGANAGVQNFGLVEAIDGGGVSITGSLTNAAGATVEALGTGSTVSLTGYLSNASGGTMEAVNGGTLDLNITDGGSNNYGTIVADGGTVNLDATGITVNPNGGGNFGMMEAVDGGTLNITGGIPNSGTIEAIGLGATVNLEAGTTTNTGGTLAALDGGTLALTNATVTNVGGTIAAHGDGSAVQLSDTTIEGGTLSTDSLTSASGGVIEVVAAGGADTSVSDGSSSAVTVDGYVQVDAGANLELLGTIDNNGVIGAYPELGASDGTITFDHSRVENTGFIDAAATGKVTFDNSYVDNDLSIIAFFGGTVTFDHSRVDTSWEIGAVDGGTVTFDRSDINNVGGGGINAGYGGTVTFDHSRVDNGSDSAAIQAQSGGVITFDHSSVDNENYIAASGLGSTITFDHSRVDNGGTITTEDSSTINFDDSSVQNSADIYTQSGTINFDDSHVDNSSGIYTVSGGTITFDDSCVDNCGTIAAYGNGSVVELSDTAISGGTLATSWDGLIETVCGDSTFDDVTIACGSNVQVNDGTSLTLQGTIDNNGTITLAPAAYDPSLVIDGLVCLQGNGSVVLSGANDNIVGACGDDCNVLINSDDISGAGQIGNWSSELTLINTSCGVIDANVSGSTLTLDTGCNTIINAGLLEANGGTLDVASNVGGCGTVTITGGGTADFQHAFDQNVTFTGAGTLELAECYGGTVSGFGTGDIFDLTNIKDVSGASGTILSYDSGNNTITVNDQKGDSISIQLSGQYTQDDFTLKPDGTGGTEVVYHNPGSGLVGEIINPFVYSVGSGLVNDANGQIIDATFVATDINYNLFPGDTDSSQTLVSQFLDYNHQTDGSTVSNTIVANATLANHSAETGTYLQMDGYIELTGGVTYTFSLNSDDGSTLSINGTQLIDDDGEHAVNDEPLTNTFYAPSTGSYAIDIRYFENYYGGASLHAEYSTDGIHFTDLTSAELFQQPLTPVTVATSGSPTTVDGPASDYVTFSGGTGTLVLNQPETFVGQIAGFTGTAPDAAHSDVIDLAGINYNSGGFSDTYNSTIGVLTVTDGTNTASLTFVNFAGSFKFASDGQGGTDIFDPPANSSGAPVSIGGPGNDNFIFHPSLGANAGNSNGPDDAAELERLSAAQAQHWSPLIGSDAHNDAIEFVHHSDSTMLPDSNAAHWHLAMHNAVNLH